jgi:hypothetical protein
MAKVLIPMTHKEVVEDIGISYQRIHYLIHRSKNCPFNYLPNGLIIPDSKYEEYKQSLLAPKDGSPNEFHEYVESL